MVLSIIANAEYNINDRVFPGSQRRNSDSVLSRVHPWNLGKALIIPFGTFLSLSLNHLWRIKPNEGNRSESQELETNLSCAYWFVMWLCKTNTLR